MGTFGDEDEVCQNCGAAIHLGLNHWLHTDHDTIYCRGADFKPVLPLTRAKPTLWIEVD